jgi:hypothetical protein
MTMHVCTILFNQFHFLLKASVPLSANVVAQGTKEDNAAAPPAAEALEPVDIGDDMELEVALAAQFPTDELLSLYNWDPILKLDHVDGKMKDPSYNTSFSFYFNVGTSQKSSLKKPPTERKPTQPHPQV